MNGLISTIKNQEAHRRERPKLSPEDLTNLAHREELTPSGNRMRENEENCKTMLLSVTRSQVFSRSWKKTVLRDPTFDR